MIPITCDIGRRGQQHLLVTLLVVVVVGLAPIWRVQGRHSDVSEVDEHEDSQIRCELPPKVESGKCRAQFSSWSYYKYLDKCKHWYYDGCGGNANRFSTQLECEQACSVSQATRASSKQRRPDEESFLDDLKKQKHDCRAPITRGRCQSKIVQPHRAYYDASKGQCLEVPRRLCVSGLNSFRQITTCQRLCMSNKQVCQLPAKVRGECAPGKASIPVWSYVESTGKCEKFLWGGCGGSANNFWERKDCEETCLGRSRSPVSTTREQDDNEEVEEEEYGEEE